MSFPVYWLFLFSLCCRNWVFIWFFTLVIFCIWVSATFQPIALCFHLATHITHQLSFNVPMSYLRKIIILPCYHIGIHAGLKMLINNLLNSMSRYSLRRTEEVQNWSGHMSMDAWGTGMASLRRGERRGERSLLLSWLKRFSGKQPGRDHLDSSDNWSQAVESAQKWGTKVH